MSFKGRKPRSDPMRKAEGREEGMDSAIFDGQRIDVIAEAGRCRLQAMELKWKSR